MRRPSPEEQSDAAQTYTVYYPSGNTLTVTGVFAVLAERDGTVVAVLIRRETDDVALDPRGVIVRDGLLIYEPRQGHQQAWVRDWLREHPDWPGVVTERPG